MDRRDEKVGGNFCAHEINILIAQRFWRCNCVVNINGRQDGFIEVDRYNEYLNNEIKVQHNPRGTAASDEFLRNVIAPNTMFFSEVIRVVHTATEAKRYGNRHSEVRDAVDVMKLVRCMLESNVFEFTPGRHQSGQSDDAISFEMSKDLWSIGLDRLKDGEIIQKALDRHWAGYTVPGEDEDSAEAMEGGLRVEVDAEGLSNDIIN